MVLDTWVWCYQTLVLTRGYCATRARAVARGSSTLLRVMAPQVRARSRKAYHAANVRNVCCSGTELGRISYAVWGPGVGFTSFAISRTEIECRATRAVAKKERGKTVLTFGTFEVEFPGLCYASASRCPPHELQPLSSVLYPGTNAAIALRAPYAISGTNTASRTIRAEKNCKRNG
eukprot:2945227-Rhodomonas_salina.2